MKPEEVVHGLEEGQGPIPGLEGFEAAEGTDSATDGAVEALQEVVAHRDQPCPVAGRRALELGDDVSRPGMASAVAGDARKLLEVIKL